MSVEELDRSQRAWKIDVFAESGQLGPIRSRAWVDFALGGHENVAPVPCFVAKAQFFRHLKRSL